MTVNVNEAGYERRLAVVHGLLEVRGLKPSKISTIAYSKYYQYHFNNFLYKVELETPACASSFPGTQPGTTKAPGNGVSVLVLKLSNLAVQDMNNANRVENDVAVQHLVRQYMDEAGMSPLIPAMYAWERPKSSDGSDETDFGWTMSEFKNGSDLDLEFPTLQTDEARQDVLEQIAAIVVAFQRVKLPRGVTKFGGLKFDNDGAVVSGESPMRKGPPASSYAEEFVDKLRGPLRTAGESSTIQGWKPNGVKDRLDKFLANGGVETVLSGVDLHDKSIIHADFTMNNLLLDKETKQITAVLDFDWSWISNPLDQFQWGFYDLGSAILRGESELEASVLSGDFSVPPSDSDENVTRTWKLSKALHVAMERKGVLTPKNMKGVDGILDMVHSRTLVCPPELRNEHRLKHMADDERAELRAKAETELVQWLDKYGF